MSLFPVRNARTLALAACLLVGPLGAAQAQSPSESHIAAARAAIDAIDATDQFDTILPGLATSLQVRLVSNNPDLEDQISTFISEEAVKLAARRADLEREAALAYARAFSEADLNAIAEFYQSDAGKALIANGPIATREVAQAAAVWQRGIERDLQTAVSQRISDANLRANPPADPPAEGETPPAEGDTLPAEGAAN